MLASQKIGWRNHTNVGFDKGFVGFYESTEEILACPYNYNVAFVGCVNRIIAGLGSGAVYLHPVLIPLSLTLIYSLLAKRGWKAPVPAQYHRLNQRCPGSGYPAGTFLFRARPGPVAPWVPSSRVLNGDGVSKRF